jgi:hypothetical protein
VADVVAASCLPALVTALLREGEEGATRNVAAFTRVVRVVRMLALTPALQPVLATSPILPVLREQVRERVCIATAGMLPFVRCCGPGVPVFAHDIAQT